jgi:cytochrome c-type biogenesis protein CcmH/NrfF
MGKFGPDKNFQNWIKWLLWLCVIVLGFYVMNVDQGIAQKKYDKWAAAHPQEAEEHEAYEADQMSGQMDRDY